jgi:glycosyltransferase involved in cell wall biosynthesis
LRILFLTHYFPPESNAPAARTYEHCVRWAREGHDVTVVTCAPNCPSGVVFAGYRNRLRRQVEIVDGVRVVRVWTYVAPNAGTMRRIVNYVSYMLSAILASLRLPRPDVVIATSPQFFCGCAGVWASRLKRAPFVLEIRDIWPESIGTVGAIRNRFVLRYLEWLERRMYRAADHIVAVGEGYKDRILERMAADFRFWILDFGFWKWLRGESAGSDVKSEISDFRSQSQDPGSRLGSPELGTQNPKSKIQNPKFRISVVTNGVDLEQFVPREPDEEFLREFGLAGKFVCSYVGTIGMAHGLEVVIEAAGLLKARGRDDIRFCLVGDGAQRARLQEASHEAGVADVVVFTGRQPKERMPTVLASSDACLVHLRGCELFGSVIPSKIFETMAMGRPIIMGVRGEAGEIVEAAGAGLLMEPDSAESLVDCVARLADDRRLLADLSASGRSHVEQHYNRDVLAERMLEIVLRTAGFASPVPEATAAAGTVLEAAAP